MKKQYRITVKGKVQRVGFRDKVDDIATDYGLCGYIQNQQGKDVFILVEGDEEVLKKLCADIRELPHPVRIKSIDICECPVEELYSDFKIIRGDPIEELGERFDTAIYYLSTIDQKQDRMLEKQDCMLDKQDCMLDKQDQMIQIQYETLSEVRELRKDIKDPGSESYFKKASDKADIKDL